MARTITDWIREQPGLTGPVPDRWNQYLASQGQTTGTHADKMNSWLAGMGYKGPYPQKVKQWSNEILE